MQAWPWTQSPGERGPHVKLRRQVCMSHLESLQLRIWAGVPWSCMGLWKASTWPREWGHACCPPHSPARVSCVPWLLLGIFQSPGLHPMPLPPARDSDEPWPEQLWGPVPRYPDQRGSSGYVDSLGRVCPSGSGAQCPRGCRRLYRVPFWYRAPMVFRVYAQLSGTSDAHCPVGWRFSLMILPPGPHRAFPGAPPVCAEHGLGVGDRGAGWRLGPGNHTQRSACASSSGAQGRNRSLKSGK